MNKQEAFEYLRNKYGYVPYVIAFDLFDEEEEIPEYMLQEPKSTSNADFIICSPEVANELDKVINQNSIMKTSKKGGTSRQAD